MLGTDCICYIDDRLFGGFYVEGEEVKEGDDDSDNVDDHGKYKDDGLIATLQQWISILLDPGF